LLPECIRSGIRGGGGNDTLDFIDLGLIEGESRALAVDLLIEIRAGSARDVDVLSIQRLESELFID